MPINSNPFVMFEPDPAHRTQAGRAASLVWSMVAWWQGMGDGEVEPDGAAGQPACMEEYAHLFGTSRIPVADGRDVLKQDPGARHIVVLRGPAFYAITVADGRRNIVSEAALRASIEEVLATPAPDGRGW